MAQGKSIKFSVEKLSNGNEEIIILNDQSIKPTSKIKFFVDKLSKELSDLPYLFFLPIFLRKGNVYKPIARQWVLEPFENAEGKRTKAKFREAKDDDDFFYAIVITDAEKVPLIRQYDEQEFKHLCGAKGVKGKKKSKYDSTNNRQTSKQKGNECPFCKGPLLKKSGRNDRAKEGFYTIGCDYWSNPAIRCTFSYECDKEWLDEFDEGIHPTEKWVEHIPDQWCPKCGDDLYFLTLTEGRRIKVCKKYLSNDSPRFSREEFKSGEAAKKNPLKPKQLCKDILDLNLLIKPPKRKYGLEWLNDLLKDNMLFDTMSAGGLVKENKAYAALIKRTEKSRGKSSDELNESELEAVMTLNRMTIENHFPSAPKLYLPNGKVCKYTSD